MKETPEQAAQELADQGISKALVPNAEGTGLEEVHIQAQVVDPNQIKELVRISLAEAKENQKAENNPKKVLR